MAFDLASLVPAGSPAPAVCWTGWAKYNFTFGNNDPDGLAVEDLKAAAAAALSRLADNVDSMKLRDAALAAGVQINPGPEWSIDKVYSKSRIRLCFASPTHDEIREGIALLAEVCRKEFGVPTRSANIERRQA